MESRRRRWGSGEVGAASSEDERRGEVVEADEDSCESSGAQGIERRGAVAREFGVDSGSSPCLVRAAGRLVRLVGRQGRRRQEGNDVWLMQ